VIPFLWVLLALAACWVVGVAVWCVLTSDWWPELAVHLEWPETRRQVVTW
jgi:hypothetical protein